MPLPSGARLGSYEITHVLGAGGMGEVYRARDSKLGRPVAIKVILAPFAADLDRIARFEREAKSLAAINHPNIAALYGMEQAEGQHFLVMELVEGETLADRLTRGPIPVEEALHVAHQIAEALEAAHEKGIVHRDLKPANIKITPDDRVKVLDFGLAKAMDSEASAANVANSPTLSMMATNAGIILGTAAYMSPEQAKGFAADHRSDIFSFGVVVYEMITGRQPFQGETAPDVLASVLVREPELHGLPADLNPRIPELLKRCLEKSPRKRWQAIGDVRAEIEAVALSPRTVPPAVPAHARSPLWRRAIPVAVASLLAAALAGAAAWRFKPQTPRPVMRFAIELPQGQPFTGTARQMIALSPDGSQLVFSAGGQLYVRALSSLAAKQIQGTDNLSAMSPVFSPDGHSVAFFGLSDRSVKRISVAGGSAVTLAETTENPFAISWSEYGVLYGQPEGIMRVSANGGKPERLVGLGPHERVQRLQMLPGGESVLFTLGRITESTLDRWSSGRVVVQSLKSGARTTLVEGASDGWYIPTGHLAYVIGGTVHAVPFEVTTLKITGTQVPIIEGVRRSPLGSTGIAWFDVAANGTLAFVPGPASLTSLQLDVGFADRKGAVTALRLPPAPYDNPRIAPDGRRVAVGIDDGKDAVILIHDLSRPGSVQRLTFGGKNRFPLWTPDGRRVAFQSDRGGDAGIYWQLADGSSPAERLTTATGHEAHVPESWRRQGDILLYSVVNGSEYALWSYSVRDGKAAPFGGVRSQAPIDAVFSPDGKWVAYTLGDPSLTTVYVQPFPETGALHELVRRGGDVPHHPVWSPDGKELIVNARPASLDSVGVTTQPSFAFGAPAVLPKGFATGPPGVRRPFDIAPDGRFVGVIIAGDTASAATSSQITVVLNWFEELKARVPGR